MPEEREYDLFISDGQLRYIHDDALTDLFKGLGPIHTRRASHVEFTSGLSESALREAARQFSIPDCHTVKELQHLLPQKWWADLGPSHGPVLGPFDKHQQAIDAELVWLKEHNLQSQSANRVT